MRRDDLLSYFGFGPADKQASLINMCLRVVINILGKAYKKYCYQLFLCLSELCCCQVKRTQIVIFFVQIHWYLFLLIIFKFITENEIDAGSFFFNHVHLPQELFFFTTVSFCIDVLLSGDFLSRKKSQQDRHWRHIWAETKQRKKVDWIEIYIIFWVLCMI